MPVSAVSRYRGGTVEDVTHLAKTMKAVPAEILRLLIGLAAFSGPGQNVGE